MLGGMESREVIDADYRLVVRSWRFPWRVTLWWAYCTGTAAFLAVSLPDQPGAAVFVAAMAWPVSAFAKALAGPPRPAEEAQILKAQLSARRAAYRRR